MFIFKKIKQLKNELNEMRNKYEDLKMNKTGTDRNNLVLININSELNRALMAIESEINQNQYGSVINLQNKIRKILADNKSNLVS